MSNATITLPKFDLENELYGDVQYSPQTKLLTRTNPNLRCLPDRPRVELLERSIEDVLGVDLLTPDLDRIAPFLWLVSTPRSSHILPLHRQKVRGRDIILCEAPALHLVWYHDKIFIKPLPGYLLSQAFWAFCKETAIFSPPKPDDRRRTKPLPAALGLLRSYSYLVRYPADLKIAQELGLLPTGITFEKFTAFIMSFEEVTDGEWNTFFGAVLAPALAVFAIISVILGALQVELAVQALPPDQAKWQVFSDVSRWFAIATLFLSASVIALLVVIILFFLVHEQTFALDILWKKRGGRAEKIKKTSAVV